MWKTCVTSIHRSVQDPSLTSYEDDRAHFLIIFLSWRLLKNWGCWVALNQSHIKKENSWKNKQVQFLMFLYTSSLMCWRELLSVPNCGSLLFALTWLLLWNIYKCTGYCKTCKHKNEKWLNWSSIRLHYIPVTTLHNTTVKRPSTPTSI